MKFLNKLERRFDRYAIENLMLVICGGQLLVYIAGLLTKNWLPSFLWLDMAAVGRGQLWRLVTFIFVPESGQLITFLLSLYFYYMIGGALENEWGSFNFNCYYLIGMVSTIIGAAFTGYGTGYYINLSMFFAFALLYPNYEILLFYIIPVKVKWVALFDALYYIYCFVVFGWPERVSMLCSLANLALFFWDDAVRAVRRAAARRNSSRDFRDQWR